MLWLFGSDKTLAIGVAGARMGEADLQKNNRIMPDKTILSHIMAERATDELRRQIGIVVQSDRSMAAFPVEFLHEEILTAFQSLPSVNLLLTAARAQSLGMEIPAKTVRIRAGELSLSQLQALADPLAQGERPKVNAAAAADNQHRLLQLAKYASLLPALLVAESDAPTFMPHWLRISGDAIRDYIDNPLIDSIETSHAALPLEGMEHTRIASFRSRYSTNVHLALIIGEPDTTAPLTRIHSSCITGDILGSLRCDCGDQLKMALQQISEAGSGILIYLHQEGRGIGITNKLRAYRLQEQGVDTYDANLMLGFEEDERDFSIAASILKKLGVSRIRLLTNNPHKLAALEKAGITVTERIGLIAPSGRHNHAYLETKARKSGHLF